MLHIRFLNPTLRAVGVISAVAIVAGGVTFAALTSNTATLADNTINTTTASLKVWNGAAFGTSASGFHVTGLVPGTGVDNPFYLQNDGGVALDLTAHVPSAPTLTGVTGNDLSKVKVDITDDHTGTVTHTDLSALTTGTVTLTDDPFAAGATGNSGVAGTSGNFHLKFDIDSGAVSGSSASVSSFDLDFGGTQHL
jgi:hypothetical protein